MNLGVKSWWSRWNLMRCGSLGRMGEARLCRCCFSHLLHMKTSLLHLHPDDSVGTLTSSHRINMEKTCRWCCSVPPTAWAQVLPDSACQDLCMHTCQFCVTTVSCTRAPLKGNAGMLHHGVHSFVFLSKAACNAIVYVCTSLHPFLVFLILFGCAAMFAISEVSTL